jgi:hypothetical protein
MKTQLRSVHEEAYSDGSRTLGVIINYTDDNSYKESFTFIYHQKNAMYIFFNTMVDLFDYLLYGESKMKRAYLEEIEFDNIYDADYVDGKFIDILKWQN